jgi:ATP-dependent DNA helicase PIF1
MFQRAVKNHNGSGGAAGAAKVTTQQQSLIKSFKHAPATTQSNATRPLSIGSGNVVKHTTAAVRRTPSKGIKRTSSGLAKALSSQDDFTDYSSLNISDSENLPPSMMNPIGGGIPTGNAPVFFDADDFDSDIDLDIEDLATKDTVKYPKLPTPRLARARDSAYASLDRDVPVKSEHNVQVKLEDSSQPVPWSSSPLSHFMTPPKPKVEERPVKRRMLPWNRTQTQANATVDEIEDVKPKPEPVRAKPRKSAPEPMKSEFTPMSKEKSKESYPWNTTASAVKQQQKNLREQNKNSTVKINDGTVEEVKAAISRKKKNNIHRIFLSEEQQHVLNLVVEFKKSVFFTGSAGKRHR